MAPPKLLKEVEGSPEVTPTTEVAPGRRVTRSLTRRSDSPAAPPQPQPQPPTKKTKKGKELASSTSVPPPEKDDDDKTAIVEEKSQKSKDDDAGGSASKEDPTGDSGSGSVANKEVSGDSGPKMKEVAAGSGSGSGSDSKTIVIERCTKDKCFKTGSDRVTAGLKKAVPGITVVINPEKPRKGCFEVREDGGQTFTSLQDLKKPFKEVKDLDVDALVADIAAKLKL